VVQLYAICTSLLGLSRVSNIADGTPERKVASIHGHSHVYVHTQDHDGQQCVNGMGPRRSL
jgi:predicted RNA-binding protein with PIN domain